MRPKIIYLKSAFKIFSEPGGPLHLFAELGLDGISFLSFQQDPFKAVGLLRFHMDATPDVDSIVAMLKEHFNEEQFFQQDFRSICCAYQAREVTLIPGEFYNVAADQPALDLLFGIDPFTNVYRDALSTYDIHTVYRLNRPFRETIAAQFPSALHRHLATLLLPVFLKDVDALHCIVYPGCIKLYLVKAGSLQLMQHYAYSSATDVLYHLLNVCKQYGMEPSVVALKLSGMIEAASSLYSELYKYFPDIRFEQLPAAVTTAEDFKQYPEHFFYHLLITAASCA